MFQTKRYPNYRSVSLMQKSGSSLLIKIDAVSNRGSCVSALILIAGVFLFTCWIFVPVLLEVRTLADALPVLLALGFVFTWCMIGLPIALRGLAVVELSIGDGLFRWRYRIWRWSREIEARREDVTAVEASVKWYGNHLNVIMNGKTYSLGDLLDDDVEVVARELRRALPRASE